MKLMVKKNQLSTSQALCEVLNKDYISEFSQTLVIALIYRQEKDSESKVPKQVNR